MIVVRSINLATGRVEISNLGCHTTTWNADLLRIAERARQVGVFEVVVRDGDELRTQALFDSELHTGSKRTRTAVLPDTYLVEHRWHMRGDWPMYRARFRQAVGCLAQISSYCAVLLASYGRQSTHLMQLRLALYEICANVVEHGLRGPGSGEIDMELRFGHGVISGCVQDDCAQFDPSRKLLSPLPVSAAQRSARGYGIHIIRQLLDDLQHEFNETGNRITFEKRISR